MSGMAGMNMSTMASPSPPPSSMAGMDMTPSTSGSGEDMMMMMQMWFYASIKVTLWFHSWSISSSGACVLVSLQSLAAVSACPVDNAPSLESAAMTAQAA